MNKIIILILTLISLITPISIARANDLTESVGALYRKDYQNNLVFTCTVSSLEHEGDGTILLTANHCISEEQRFYLVTFDGLSFHLAELYKIPRQKPDDPRSVDVALLKLPGVKVQSLGTLASKTVALGADIHTVGFPLGTAKVLYKGYLAGRVDNIGAGNNDYLILQIFGAPGSSGTAVVDVASGRIIGVLVAVSGGSIGMPVVYATPIEYLMYLVTPAEKRRIQRDEGGR